ncbi:MAG: heat-inducible transcription repressor HrcA [Clostridia bacterium]|nr:heat-inducible transcription repressor HrcA [Clostridia bacterium]
MTALELSLRKQLILSAVVRHHINTGEPISSKALCELLDIGLSSATIRNELFELCELGYLEQPHTSAGRIPTGLGYRTYVTHLMKPERVSNSTKNAIDSLLDAISADPENFPSTAGEVLSNITGLPVLLATVPRDDAYVKRVELLPVSRRVMMLLMITSDGMARSRVCRCGYDLTADVLMLFDRIISVNVIGTNLSVLNAEFLKKLIIQVGSSGVAIVSLLSATFEMIDDIRRSTVKLRGEAALYDKYRSEVVARRLMDFITRRDAVLSIMSSIDKPVDVVFGSDTEIDELRDSGMVVARFKSGDNDLGRVGVFGPTRMSYEEIIPSVHYFADRLSAIMTQALRDMEDQNGN